jgi:adenine-specific DNA-methyltransferase
MESKTRLELIELCKAQQIKGYSNKTKKDLISLLTKSNQNMSSKKTKGQYFTESSTLQDWIFEKTKHKQTELLEPSFGAGHLLKKFLEYDPNYKMECYEIDESIQPIVLTNTNQKITYSDFTQQKFTKKFKTIIGNPPYVKKTPKNLYITFIELCFNLLDTNGELLFIVPSDFIKLTSASKLIMNMTKEGSFTDFYFPHDETLFKEAAIDVMCFRYEKGLHTNKTTVNNQEKYAIINNGIIIFSDTEHKGQTLETQFDIYVGIVSGKDEVYKVPYGNIEILTDKDKVEKFIYVTEFPSNNEEIDRHLETHKTALKERKIRKFNDTNWFEWGALRNIQTVINNLNKPCIYVRNMTRQKEVAFVGKVQYFGGSLLCLIPKIDIDLAAIVNKLNTEQFKENYMYAGRFKIGQKQLCNTII